MLKLKSIFIAFLLLWLTACGGQQIPTSAPPLFISQENISDNRNFVNVSIDAIKFLGQTGDVAGKGEFRLLIIGADTSGRSSGTYCPGNAPIQVNQGDVVRSPCLFVISFDENNVSDGVFLMVIALDEDKSSLPADLSYEVASNSLAWALTKYLEEGGMIAADSSGPVGIGVGVLISFVGGKTKDWIQKADVI